ncbi:hypothetical protein B9Z55_015691 [Caenorhabditis nigoni]|nr:hypothetical protein B9Z55_015691 [Caenorhabditis nigoni]
MPSGFQMNFDDVRHHQMAPEVDCEGGTLTRMEEVFPLGRAPNSENSPILDDEEEEDNAEEIETVRSNADMVVVIMMPMDPKNP